MESRGPLRLRKTFALAAQKMIENLFGGIIGILFEPDGWNSFYKRYPGSG